MSNKVYNTEHTFHQESVNKDILLLNGIAKVSASTFLSTQSTLQYIGNELHSPFARIGSTDRGLARP